MKLLKIYCSFLFALFIGLALLSPNTSVKYADLLNKEVEIESEIEDAEVKCEGIFGLTSGLFDGGDDTYHSAALLSGNFLFNALSKHIAFNLPSKSVLKVQDLYLLFCSLKIHFS